MKFFFSTKLKKPVSRGAIRSMYGHRVDGWEAEDFAQRGFLPAERTPINVNRFLAEKSEKEAVWEEVDGVYRQVWDFEDLSESEFHIEAARRVVADEVAKRINEVEGMRQAFPDSESLNGYLDSLKALVDEAPQELAWAVWQETYEGWPLKPDSLNIMRPPVEEEEA